MPYRHYSHHKWEDDNNFKFERRSSILEIDYPHYHDFHEISLLTKGSIIYTTQNIKEEHGAGTLLFTKEGEVHGKQADEQINLLQVAFPHNVFKDMQLYLGGDVNIDDLLNSKTTVKAVLFEQDIREIKSSFDDIFIFTDLKRKLKQKFLLLRLVSLFFLETYNPTDVPYPWLVKAMRKMENPENLAEGLPAFIRLTGRCHEYVCRCMSTVYGTTPTAFVNKLKLQYSENLLVHSEMEVLEIVQECGFNSVSNFYSLFKRKNSLTPMQFRKKHYQHFPKRVLELKDFDF